MSTDNNKKNNNDQNAGANNYDFNELASTMTQGIRRWEKVIYPMMIAFIILAAYGFWLIYNLTKDMHNISTNMLVMTNSVVSMNNTLDARMAQVTDQMAVINTEMSSMNENMGAVTTMNSRITEMTDAINSMNASINSMSHSVYSMVYSTRDMSSNIGELNDNFSAPMNSINSIVPWSAMPGRSKTRRYSPPQSPGVYGYPYTAQVPQYAAPASNQTEAQAQNESGN